jgi:C-terminal processing protease CtpA/Prc
LLGDNHSGLWLADTKKQEAIQEQKSPQVPTSKRIHQWAYLHLPKSIGDEDAKQHYAQAGHNLLRHHDNAQGWIIDLRENRGGSMWPMLVVCGPIAGDGTLGYFQNRHEERVAWGYENGASIYDGDTVYAIADPIPTISSDIPVAVLIGERTASSGEILLISLSRRENLRTFGQATRGKPTANTVFDLPDGASLVLTTDVSLDRKKRLYERSILPDVPCTDALTEAETWLQSFG